MGLVQNARGAVGHNEDRRQYQGRNVSDFPPDSLDLQPRASGGPFLADGDVIARDDTQTPLPVEKLLLDVDTTVRSVPKEALVTTFWQESDSGPPRRYYRLTDAGAAALTAFSDDWARFRDGVDALLTHGGRDDHDAA